MIRATTPAPSGSPLPVTPFAGPFALAVAVAVAVGSVPGALVAQETPAESPEPCASEDHRAFDFWIGEWEVRNPEGEVVGENRITRVAGGCGLLEEWAGAGGSTGVSVNRYDPASGSWRQSWVGGNAVLLELKGGLQDGSMVLEGGPRKGPRGRTVVDRIRWTPREDGVVRQLWEVSTDGGETWQAAFDGRYHPK